MISKLLATTAIATVIAVGASSAYAQTAPAPVTTMEQAAPNVIHADGHLASNLIGQTVYSSSADDAENIGSVTDLVISEDGDVEGVVVAVGGFLGIGQKHVALEYDAVEWVQRDDTQWLVIPTNRESLEALPEFDTAAYSPMPADAEVGNTKPATAQEIGAATTTAPADGAATTTAPAAPAPATDTAPAANAPAATTNGDTAMAPAVDRSTLTETPVTGMSADDFIGTTVYGANDENVGEIEDVILATDGNAVEAVILDVGGFLGIGSKSVAVSMDNLNFMADGDGNSYLYTPFTQEQLEAQPAYDEATYADNRDQQLILVPAN